MHHAEEGDFSEVERLLTRALYDPYDQREGMNNIISITDTN